MKIKWNITYLPVLVLGCGGISGALWGLMQKFCVDEKGLLLSWNLPGLLILLLSLAVVAGVVLLTRPLGGSNRYVDNFGPSAAGGISAFAAAVGILVTLLGNLGAQQDLLFSAWLVLGGLSVPALVLAGICRMKGKRPHFLLHGILCAFFGIHMANQYRSWSSDPQMADYICQLFACVFLTMTAYFQAAFAVGMGRRLKLLLMGLLAAYFSLACVCVEGSGLFYLTCGIWSAANLCNMVPMPRRKSPVQEPPAPETTEEEPPAQEAEQS